MTGPGGTSYRVRFRFLQLPPTGGSHAKLALVAVFPEPKLSHRLFTAGDTQWWGYLAGEFGGGRWIVEQADGSLDSVDYTDVRAMLGLESIRTAGLKGHVDIGYVFARRVNFTSNIPDFKPHSTLMLRVGLSY